MRSMKSALAIVAVSALVGLVVEAAVACAVVWFGVDTEPSW